MAYKDVEKQKLRNREYREAHREEIRLANKAWREANKDKIKRNRELYRLRNPERLKERKRLYYERNREKIIQRNKIYRQRFPNSTRTNHLKKFNITIEGYAHLLEQQNSVCAICFKPERAKMNGKIKKLSVDHNHVTGRVRGLLCSVCNTGIGKLQEDKTILLSAINYLERNQ